MNLSIKLFLSDTNNTDKDHQQTILQTYYEQSTTKLFERFKMILKRSMKRL